jgi:4-amino-4-deoxy-L-arabinose transferase-like glycosyltransferase
MTPGRAVAGFCAFAFVLRAAIGLFGPEHFWAYTNFYEMAKNVAHGVGYCLGDDGTLCAYFPPVYPTIVAAGVLIGHPVLTVVLISSLLGAGTVWLTYLIGFQLFGTGVGLMASAYAAVYPYYVWHDTVLQENSTLAFVVAGAIYLLLRASRSDSTWLSVAAGAVAGLTVLTKANLTLFLLFVLVWTAVAFGVRRTLWIAVGAVIVVGPWVVRTWRITGEPILYSNGGFSLWTANHRLTFDYFPERRIDDASVPEWEDLTPQELATFQSISDPNWIEQTHWLWNKGVDFIRAHPWLTLRRAVYKIWIGFSPRFSPAKGWLFQTIYFISYAPVLALACWGAWLSRYRWRDMAYIYAAFLGFVLGTAVFWAHTSHRMYLEPYLMILASYAVVLTKRHGEGFGQRLIR